MTTIRNRALVLCVASIIIILIPKLSISQPEFVESDDLYIGKADIFASQQVTLLPGFHAINGSDVHAYIDPLLNMPSHNYDPTTGNIVMGSTPSEDQNYILTTVLRAPTTNSNNIDLTENTQKVDYFDGLGRPIQEVVPKYSSQLKDLIFPKSFDGYGREDKNYLPFISQNSTGAFNPNATSGCVTYYSQTSGVILGREPDYVPYSTTLFEDSPLNRIIGTRGVGQNWVDHPTSVNYLTNSTPILQWKAIGSQSDFTSITYLESCLFITENIDEDGKTQRSYVDKLGKTVRVEKLDGSNVLRTAYIYDDFGLLRCVVPPKVSDNDGPNNTELCFYYNYDERKRLIEKSIPGAGMTDYIYDNRDRLALWQDENMRNQILPEGKRAWHYQLYDAFDRPVVTGILTTSNNVQTIRNDFKNFEGTLFETWSSTGPLYGYSSQSFPASYALEMNLIESVIWYDKYNFLLNFLGYDFPDLPPGGNTSNAFITDPKGLVTGSLDKFNLNESQDHITVNYYDDQLRIICKVSNNHLNGFNNEFYGYNFNNQIVENIQTHNSSYVPDDIIVIDDFSYDHQGRLLENKFTLNGQNPFNMKAFEYNEIGDVINTYLHGSSDGQNYSQKISNTYNIKGWLRKINDPQDLDFNLFALDLRYNNPITEGPIASEQSYNGNISQMLWNTKYDLPRGYGFEYDNLNRLTSSEYGDGSNFTDHANGYNTAYSYDFNSNLSTLNRSRENILIDQLNYSYQASGNSNRLRQVTDQGTQDGYVPCTGEYEYDFNGNMVYDPSKKINVSYNYLNLPTNVMFGPEDQSISYYTSTGTKIRKDISSWRSIENTITDYCGPFIYEDNCLASILTATGRIIPIPYEDNIVLKYEYYMTDHLGNVHLVYSPHDNGEPEILQYTNYYPFGMTLKKQDYYGLGILKNNYLYNGKELQGDEMAGSVLSWYDYGARFYDPVLGRWHVVDMLAEEAPEWSPYRYGFNSPVNVTDPTGMFEDWYEDENNKMVYNENIKNQADIDAAGIKGTYKGEEGYGINDETGQVVHYQKDGNAREFTQTLAETSVTSDGEVYLSKNPSISTNNQTGYTYNDRDLQVRSKIINSTSPIGRFLRSQESQGIFWILNAHDYWIYYGHTLGNMILMDQYIMMADMINSGDPSVQVSPKVRSFNFKYTSSTKTAPGSFSEFLKVQKGKDVGKYPGRGEWMKQQALKYKKLKN